MFSNLSMNQKMIGGLVLLVVAYFLYMKYYKKPAPVMVVAPQQKQQ
jgi:hypothetical protein